MPDKFDPAAEADKLNGHLWHEAGTKETFRLLNLYLRRAYRAGLEEAALLLDCTGQPGHAAAIRRLAEEPEGEE
jgi:hypothetical protein